MCIPIRNGPHEGWCRRPAQPTACYGVPTTAEALGDRRTGGPPSSKGADGTGLARAGWDGALAEVSVVAYRLAFSLDPIRGGR
jgi:hypothetical protein